MDLKVLSFLYLGEGPSLWEGAGVLEDAVLDRTALVRLLLNDHVRWVEGLNERWITFREYCNEMVTARGIVSPRDTTSIGVIPDIVVVALVSNTSRVTHDEDIKEKLRGMYDRKVRNRRDIYTYLHVALFVMDSVIHHNE